MRFFKEYEESSYKESSELFEVEIKQLMRSQNSPFLVLYNEVIKLLQKAQSNRNIEIGMDDTIVNSFVSCFKNPKTTAKYTHQFWKKYLGLEHAEASVVYEHIDISDDNKKLKNAKYIFEEAKNESPDYKVFKDINQLEPQLTYLNILFDYLLSKSQDKIHELDNDYILPLMDFKWDNLSIDQNTSVFYRVEELKKVKNYETLVDYHKIVMQKRGQTPWIELKDGTIKTNIFKNTDGNKLEESLSKGLNNDWINDYYINSMRNIKHGLSL